MPILVKVDSVGGVLAALPAFDGLRVQVSAPPDTDTSGVPPGGMVVGWVLVTDGDVAGGARVDPVFLADGRAWTPDQYRAAFGQTLNVRVGRAQ
ncbi:hypothetical protein [Streptomyces sp. H27-D2]|uniref:hypothetical protein n=1 Tax=Streptomyces sp. H27-D2 TaxID=3046304 RepID=UPI002DB9ADF6|nr:hypothetical protein [Streptomyces sp. H27-D2]MEC4016107.1 hypothetical protein [Streptomyces sp. H27-D2]